MESIMKYIKSPAAKSIADKIRRNDREEFIAFLLEGIGGVVLFGVLFIGMVLAMAAFG